MTGCMNCYSLRHRLEEAERQIAQKDAEIARLTAGKLWGELSAAYSNSPEGREAISKIPFAGA